MVSKNSLMYKIEARYDSFSEANKRIANWIRKNIQLLDKMTITNLAEECGVSDATLVRFSRELGYDGFYDMKKSISNDNSGRISIIQEDVEFSDDITNLYNKICDGVVSALDNTRLVLDPAAVEQLIEAISVDRNIVIIGLGSSSVICRDLQHKLTRLGYVCQAYSDVHMQLISISNMKKNDLLIAVSHSGSSKEIINAMQLAKQKGITTVAMTSYAKSSIVKHSDIILFVSSRETSFHMLPLASRIAQLCLVDLIYVSLAIKDGALGIERINSLENFLKGTKE